MKKLKRVLKKRENKKGFSMPFEWVFAMLIGGVILFIAIYAVVHIMSLGQGIVNTGTAAQIESYLSPYETGQGSGISDELHFSVQSKLLFQRCEPNNSKPFGMQTFAFTEKMFGKYGKESERIAIVSKYVFANETIEGKDIYIVSIPYFMGYKVSDLFLIYSGKYCFFGAPDNVKDDIGRLQLKNIDVSDNQSCKGINVCFDGNGKNCSVRVSSPERYVEKNGKRMYYTGNLIYAAIFSSDKIYECNVKRLMNKFNELGWVYLEKIKIMEMKGCSSNIQLVLNQAMKIAKAMPNSQGLQELDDQILSIDKINEAASEGCRLFINE
jgi:hypothetical protein